jgi:hypothetical protein
VGAPVSIDKLVQRTPITTNNYGLWFMIVTALVFIGFLSQLITGGATL